MTKKSEREKLLQPAEMSEQTFKRLVERLLSAPPKHKLSKPSKKTKRHSGH